MLVRYEWIGLGYTNFKFCKHIAGYQAFAHLLEHLQAHFKGRE
jgi:hypothetical protein